MWVRNTTCQITLQTSDFIPIADVEDVITVSGEAQAVGLCATCCRHPMPLASGGDVEALAQRPEQDPDTYHAANQAAVVFLAPHTEEGYSAIPVWVIPTCGRFKADHCHAVGKHLAELCGNAAFRTAMVTSCPQIRTVTHGSPVRCKRHCMPRVRAPSPGCLRFHIFRSKRMSSGFVVTSTPPT